MWKQKEVEVNTFKKAKSFKLLIINRGMAFQTIQFPPPRQVVFFSLFYQLVYYLAYPWGANLWRSLNRRQKSLTPTRSQKAWVGQSLLVLKCPESDHGQWATWDQLKSVDVQDTVIIAVSSRGPLAWPTIPTLDLISWESLRFHSPDSWRELDISFLCVSG